MRLLAAALALGLVAMLPACDDDAITVEVFTAVLTGAKERPTPVVTAATGSATVTVRNDSVFYQVTVNGLSGVATLAHIHAPADTGQAIPPAADLTITAVATGTLANSFFIAPSNVTISRDSLVRLMRAGRAYVNVHTVANATGEIRGQLQAQ